MNDAAVAPSTVPAVDMLVAQHRETMAECRRHAAEAAKIESALVTLRRELAGAEEAATQAAATDGEGAFAAVLDGGSVPKESADAVRTAAQRQRLRAAVAAGEKRLAAAEDAMRLAKMQADGLVDDIAQAEAKEAARALTFAWPHYQHAWRRYVAAASNAGWYVSRSTIEGIELDGETYDVAKVDDALVSGPELIALIDNATAAKLRREAR